MLRTIVNLIAIAAVATVWAEAPGRIDLGGVVEMRFNAVTGKITARTADAPLAADEPDVRVFINDVQLDEQSIKITRDTIEIDYVLEDGVNDILVTAVDENGRALRGDALIWAGSQTLVVDVVDADQNPLDAAQVTVKLASGTGIQAKSKTASGTARIENLPAVPVLVRVVTREGDSIEVATQGDAGSILVTVP